MKQKDARLGSDTYATAADKLAATITQPDISYMSLYADYNTSLLAIKQKRSSNSPTTEETNVEVDLGDNTKTPLMFAQSLERTVRDDLINTSTGQILLITVVATPSSTTVFAT